MTDRFMWSPNLITFLISLYRTHRCLYDTTHPEYISKVKREQSMTTILKELQKINPNLQLHYVKTKLHNLRTQYMREHRKVVSSIRGNSNQPTYKPTLWCYEKLSFLRKHRKRVPNPNRKKDDDVCSPDEEDPDCDAVVPLTYEDNHTLSKTPIPNTAVHTSNLRIIPCTCCNNKVCEILHKDNYPTSKIPNLSDNYPTSKIANANNCTTAPSSNLRIVSCSSISEGNDFVAASDANNYPPSDRRNLNIENLEDELKQQIDDIRCVLAQRGKTKNNKYDWLGKQVVFEINKIKNEVLQEETAWAIQNILRKNVCKDRTWQQQDFYRSQNQNQVNSTPKNVQNIRTVTINPNEGDPLAEDLQDIIEEDVP